MVPVPIPIPIPIPMFQRRTAMEQTLLAGSRFSEPEPEPANGVESVGSCFKTVAVA